MGEPIKIGLVGLDTSHAKVFTRLLNDPGFEFHIPGAAKVVAGYPCGSPDFRASISRVKGITEELRCAYGVTIMQSPEAVAKAADAVFITAVDGRVHLDLFRQVAACRKPVFVDKPFAVTSAEAREIMGMAAQYRIPCMSASVRRYAEALQDVHKRQGEAPVTGAECFGPIEFVPTQPGWYWYGIHTVEALYELMGRGCESVTAVSGNGHELIIGKWHDGRVGLARGNAHPNVSHGALIHRANGTTFIDTASDGLQKYGRLMEAVLAMIRTGKPAVEPEETLEIIRFIEAANESRETGNTVYL